MPSTPRIATITLNPAIDQTAMAADFTVDAVNRVSGAQLDAGGKGVNVASFLARFGHDVVAAGILGKDNCGVFDALFKQAGIEDQMLKLPGRTRVNIKILDHNQGTVTDINFPGLSLGPITFEEARQKVLTLAESSVSHFVLAGSLPETAPLEIYHDLILALKSKGARVYLDTSGDALKLAMPSGPHVIKPNLEELQQLVGKQFETLDEIVASVRTLNEGKTEVCAVSMGEAGALFVTIDKALLAIPPARQVRSTVGAGDAMVAGLIHAELAGHSLEDIARISTGFALGALGEIGPRLPAAEVIQALADSVTIQIID